MKYSNLSNFLHIPETLKVVSACWEVAEHNLRNDIKDNTPGVSEEFITQIFHGKLAQTLREASDDGFVERAFLSDLRRGFPDLANRPELGRIARGLIADLTLHKRDTEKITGGDFGFMIIRPQVTRSLSFLKISDYRRGILSQAKLKRMTGRWGRFTKSQKNVLPQRLGYLGLLLYSYEDKQRRTLQQFQWQLCNNASLDEVTTWLKNNSFPSVVDSSSIIQALGNAKIGTDNKQIIDEIISPAGNPSLTITISWPEGGGPGSQVYVYTSQQTVQKTQIKLRH